MHSEGRRLEWKIGPLKKYLTKYVAKKKVPVSDFDEREKKSFPTIKCVCVCGRIIDPRCKNMCHIQVKDGLLVGVLVQRRHDHKKTCFHTN